jgi:NodT family efflux transporter outer membrane factor (OMF) lipoprotein
VTAEVARTYIEVRRFETLIALAQQNEAVQAEGLQIAESRFRNGATSELDVAQAKNLLETTRASIPKLQLGLVQTHNALSTLLGRPTGFVRTLLATPAAIPAPPAQVAISVPGEMLRRRPDIRAAEMRARAQCERIGVAKADYYPNFNLFGFVGTQTSTGANNGSTFTDLFASGSLFGFAGGNLLLPLLNYKRIHSNVQLQDALYRQLLVDYVDTVLRAAQEVEDNMTGYLRQQDAEVFEQNAVDAADNAVKLALTMYREGATDYERVLQTQRALLESQNELADTRASVITNLIALYKALGGGWEIRLQPPRGR